MLRSRASAVLAISPWMNPLSSAAPMPPLASMSWNSVQLFCASSSVIFSMNQAPCAGSKTRPSELSSCSTRCVLRAMRRAKASGLPSAQVKGSTVTASAPPSAPPAQAMVVRSMFTQGSRRAIMRSDVAAHRCIRSAACVAPHASATRAVSLRAARSLAIVRNRSASAASARPILANAKRGLSPRALAGAQIGDQRGQHRRQLLGLAGAGFVIGPAVGEQRRDIGHGRGSRWRTWRRSRRSAGPGSRACRCGPARRADRN